MNSRTIARLFITVSMIVTWSACKKVSPSYQLFTLLDSSQTGINFANNLPYTEELNTYTYRNFYNGGGVALGDVNNDGLLDVYITGNLEDNKLYINKGDFKFEDVTSKAGVACSNVWSTGATMVDINGDGWLDIYVCKGGPPGGSNRHNELFINNGDLTFMEQSKDYGLDILGLSIHSAFFDFDRDGDLDAYILNNSLRSVGGFDLVEGQRNTPDPEGNKFMRNDNGKFVNVASELGIYTSNIGYGLGITLSDFNSDGWTDIFISNDFFEKDYLYLNLEGKRFKEVGSESFGSMSMGSMGADAADLDNDLLPDLFVTEMLPVSQVRKKTKNQYETWDKYRAAVQKGYHHQYSRNALQKNLGNGQFFELSRFAGVEASEWSWAALIQDFDNDGLKDIFVSNGLYKDLLDRDYLNFYANDYNVQQRVAANQQNVITQLVDSMPSEPLVNAFYRNKGNFEFENVAHEIGLEQKTFSNGSAYGDLDNDGDLDLVVNNANMPFYIYRNNTDTLKNRFIKFNLKGDDKNRFAIGAKIMIKYEGGHAMVEQFGARGFESSVIDKVHFGVGGTKVINEATINWPNGKQTVLKNLTTNKTYLVDQKTALLSTSLNSKVAQGIQYEESVPFIHQESDINLFSRERLLTEMPGFNGPGIAVGDINRDGSDDIFCGGGRGQKSVLYLSTNSSSKWIIDSISFQADMSSEVVDAVFFDADQDGDLDLYCAHGGRSISSFSSELNDILYINDGKGKLIKKPNFVNFPKPIATSQVTPADLNNDSKIDLVITEAFKDDVYGIPGSVHLLINKGSGNFEYRLPKSMLDIGMITSSAVADIDQDGKNDIVLAGKWMPITVIKNDGSLFESSKQEIIPNSAGLWNTIISVDVDFDGDMDLVAGNEGFNSHFKKEDILLINDFDGNGTAEQLIFRKENGKYFPIHDCDEMFSQIPSLKKRFLFYRKFAAATLDEIFDKEVIKQSIRYQLDELKTSMFINERGKFSLTPFPNAIQYSSVHTVYNQGQNLYFGGNTFRVKPQFGRLDASMGWLLKYENEGKKLKFFNPQNLGLQGELRKIRKFNNSIIFAANNGKIKTLIQE
jgi:enediyne biosynthesis protein E4